MAENSAISWTRPAMSGPKANAPRDGDRKQARRRINVEVRSGRREHPNDLPCVDCGHIWSPGERRHEYDHHKGYAAEHHYDVEPVCTVCHAARHNVKSHCIRGHEFTIDNTGRNSNGTRYCKECRRFHDRNRVRDAAYWRAYRAKRKFQNG